MSRSLKPFLRAYLAEAPLFMAIVRSVECGILRAAHPMQSPVLDLGCGDGLLAATACAQPPEFGLDPSWHALREAASRAAHGDLSCASATELPFRDHSIRTVLCNSVIEHISGIDDALRECHRVLAPGGRLLLTTPSHQFAEMLLGTRVLRALGLSRAASAYGNWFNAHSLHFHTLSETQWRTLLAAHGFIVHETFYYLAPRAHGVFDAMHYLSLWRWLHHRFTGKWVGKWAPLNAFWVVVFESLTRDSGPRETGPYLFIDAGREA